MYDHECLIQPDFESTVTLGGIRGLDNGRVTFIYGKFVDHRNVEYYVREEALRHPIDEPNPLLGEQVATARALHALADKIAPNSMIQTYNSARNNARSADYIREARRVDQERIAELEAEVTRLNAENAIQKMKIQDMEGFKVEPVS